MTTPHDCSLFSRFGNGPNFLFHPTMPGSNTRLKVEKSFEWYLNAAAQTRVSVLLSGSRHLCCTWRVTTEVQNVWGGMLAKF
jgi:hypothetical protein